MNERTVVARPLVSAWAISAAKVVAITIGFAVAYVVMVEYSPIPAKSSFMGLAFGKTLRVANVLRAFALVTPLAPIGTTLGSMYMKIGQPFSDYIGVFVSLWLGLSVWWASKRIGRSLWKDLGLMAFYGAMSGLIVTLSHAGLAMFLGQGVFREMVQDLIGFKMVSSMFMHMAGVPLVGAWDYVRRSRQ